MIKRAVVVVWTLALIVSVASADPSETIVVVGQADRTVDRQNVQDAIDAASPGASIVLEGTFLLDGERIFISNGPLTLTGAPVDNDSDGRVNEDWGDGVDNDGEGLTDEDDWDSVLEGIAEADGTPASDGMLDYYYNRAISIEGVTGTAGHIAIRHLKLTTFDRGINIFPEYFWGTKRCEDLVHTGGQTQHVTIEDNWFENSYRDIVVNGTGRDMTAQRNHFVGSLSGSVLLIGELFGCIRPDGMDDPVPMGVPLRNRFVENRFAPDANGWGLLSIVSEKTTVRRNSFAQGWVAVYSAGDDAPMVDQNVVANELYGIAIEGSAGASVLQNRLIGGFIGLDGALPSPNSRFANNVVTGSVLGLVLELWASGFTAVNNDYVESWDVDVFLDDTTFQNTIIVNDSTTTVADLGTDNKLIGTLASTYHARIPDAARHRREELRKQIASQRP